MMIGRGFAEGLRAAGLLGLPFSWGPDGKVEFGEGMTQAQKDAVQAVLAAHDPSPYTEAEEKGISAIRDIDGAKALISIVRALKVQFLVLDVAKLVADAKAIYKTL